MSNEMLFSSFGIIIFRKSILFKFSSSVMNFMVGIMLLNILRTSNMFVLSFLYTMRISSYMVFK
jgi:hypothetical protein